MVDFVKCIVFEKLYWGVGIKIMSMFIIYLIIYIIIVGGEFGKKSRK